MHLLAELLANGLVVLGQLAEDVWPEDAASLGALRVKWRCLGNALRVEEVLF